MNERAWLLLVAAGAAGLIAVGGFLLMASFDAFAPCRVGYYVSDQVYGSLACQLYYTIALFSAVLAFAACAMTAIAGILFLVRRRRAGR
ncbi:MAG TPA: hypothetical protein VHH11_00300 [Gammaproteobacteria bacterium]|jgi:hypothetical protein|nr:hypothetical protein [Gammaproteobacteria bacterium]